MGAVRYSLRTQGCRIAYGGKCSSCAKDINRGEIIGAVIKFLEPFDVNIFPLLLFN